MTSEPLTTEDACVLIVDDEEDIRETLKDVVEMIGCTAALAADGVEALAWLKCRRPCLVILDLRMPLMSGNELFDAMQRDAALADVPVVISTSAPANAPRGVLVIPKPIDIDDVWSAMKRSCKCVHVPAG